MLLYFQSRPSIILTQLVQNLHHHIFWFLAHSRAEGAYGWRSGCPLTLWYFDFLQHLNKVHFDKRDISIGYSNFNFICQGGGFIHCSIFTPRVVDDFHVESCPRSSCNSIFTEFTGRVSGGPRVTPKTGFPWITFDGGLYCELSVLAVVAHIWCRGWVKRTCITPVCIYDCYLYIYTNISSYICDMM